VETLELQAKKQHLSLIFFFKKNYYFETFSRKKKHLKTLHQMLLSIFVGTMLKSENLAGFCLLCGGEE
jgi:hypothetical protein